MSRNDCLTGTGDYRVIAEIADPDGVNARITRRVNAKGQIAYSFRFFRVFFKDGKTRETAWMDPRHLPAMLRLSDQVSSTIDSHREETTAP